MRTGYSPNGKTPKQQTYCKLDIDIYKNLPHVHMHEKRPNDEGWRGTEISVVIGGNWSTYKVCALGRQAAIPKWLTRA